MNALTRETGGRAYFPTSIGELDSVYDRIAEELRTLYSVGYVSSNARRDGKWRRIVVRVPDREGITDPPQARLLRAEVTASERRTRSRRAGAAGSSAAAAAAAGSTRSRSAP